jgi:molybdopterin-guanine dinucleotide biosynthesis protein A
VRVNGVVLAGGQARRMGGRDKPAARVGGVAILVRVVRAVLEAGDLDAGALDAGADGVRGEVMVVGPRRASRALPAHGVGWTCEDPPGGGPAAALEAGLAALPEQAGLIAVLAADLPFLDSTTVRRLAAAATTPCPPGSGGQAGSRVAGAVLIDASGVPQWLAGVWDERRLRAAVDRRQAAGQLRGVALRAVLGPLDPVLVAVPPGDAPAWWDCDEPAQLAQARRWMA